MGPHRGRDEPTVGGVREQCAREGLVTGRRIGESHPQLQRRRAGECGVGDVHVTDDDGLRSRKPVRDGFRRIRGVDVGHRDLVAHQVGFNDVEQNQRASAHPSVLDECHCGTGDIAALVHRFDLDVDRLIQSCAPREHGLHRAHPLVRDTEGGGDNRLAHQLSTKDDATALGEIRCP